MTGHHARIIPCGSATLLGAALLAGCGSSAAVDAPATGAGSPAATAETPAGRPGTSEEFAGLRPFEVCALLDDGRLETLRLTAPGIPDDLGGDPHCEWRTPQVAAVLSVLANGSSIDQIPTATDETVVPAQIDGRRARIFTATDPTAGCTVYVDLGATAYLEANALVLTAGEGRIDECALATDIATIATTTLTTGRPR